MMKYDATVRLGGDLNNSVPKFGMTAPEVLILQSLHGTDAVVDIVAREMDKRPHAEERDRLASIYGGKVVVELFGAPLAGTQLPIKLPFVADPVVTESEFAGIEEFPQPTTSLAPYVESAEDFQ